MEKGKGDGGARRYFLEVSYHGAAYKGWQIQPNASSVQAVLEDCLSKQLRQPIKVTGSGRTDAGVHCRRQFAHFDTEADIVPKDFLHRMNAFLPQDIALQNIYRVKPEAHARFNAISRAYEYYITLEKAPLLQGLAYHYTLNEPLNIAAMNEAAGTLAEYEDFKAFSKTNTDVHHYRCKILGANWKKKAGLLIFRIEANRFLRGMVRLVTGAMVEVGRGKMSLTAFREIIEIGAQDAKRFSVPPEGLYLVDVSYPADIFLHSSNTP